MIVGLTYKPGVADMRNSLNFKIFKKRKNPFDVTNEQIKNYMNENN